MKLANRCKARTALLVAVVCVSFSALATGASAKTVGTLPPKNPGRNCKSSSDPRNWNMTLINRCRTAEGVGPLRLPSNWSKLTPQEQMLVIIDLERVNRGLAPVVGLSATVNKLAQAGAKKQEDPNFPANGFFFGGAIWAGLGSVIESDFAWMYDDGYGSDNSACTSRHAKGCWEHRDIILVRSKYAIVGGGGYVHGKPWNSYAFELLTGYSQKHLTFTWKSELKHFKSKPGLEPLH